MFNKNESALLRTEFWTAFGRYMKPVPCGEGNCNWINYKTGVRDIKFRMEADYNSVLLIFSGQKTKKYSE